MFEYIFFDDSLMCPTSFWGILNPITSTNILSSSNNYANFPLYISLAGCLGFSYTIVMYFIFLLLPKLLVFSVGTITVSLTSNLCRSLLVSLSFSFFSGHSVSYLINESSLSNWVRNVLTYLILSLYSYILVSN